MAGKRKTVDSCVDSWLEILAPYIYPLQDAPFFSLNLILYLLGTFGVRPESYLDY